MSAVNRILARARSGEEGWLIIEIMIGAVTLIIAGLAIYAGLDRASSASGRNRNRSVASFLAQQDQERLRSLDTTALTGYIKTPNVQTINVGGNNYTVKSTVQWANDSNGTSTGCASTTAVATYLRITSTVTDPTNKNGPVSTGQPAISPFRPGRCRGADRRPIGHDRRAGHTGDPRRGAGAQRHDRHERLRPVRLPARDQLARVLLGHRLRGQGRQQRDDQQAADGRDGLVVGHPVHVRQGRGDPGRVQGPDRTANTARGRGFTVFQGNWLGNQEKSLFTGTGASDMRVRDGAERAARVDLADDLFPFTSSLQRSGPAPATQAKPTLASDIRAATVTPAPRSAEPRVPPT